MKEKIFSVLQRVGRAFMLPIAILPVAGLLLGIGSSFTNVTTLETYHLLNIMGPGTFLYSILTVMNKCGSIIFDNLPLIFAIGVAIGMAKKEKEVAALAAAIAFLVMHSAIGAMIDINGGVDALMDGAATSVLGITSLQMGAFGGIIVGLGVAALHNRFYNIKLPQALSFFGGTRFVPIISAITYVLVGILMFYVWQPIQTGIYALGSFVMTSGYIGTFAYGLIKRLLIPFGLHHVFYLPFWQTAVGGTMNVAGHVVEGAQNIFFAQLADPLTIHFASSATRFFTGEFIVMIFGLPGAAYAMYRAARPEKKKEVGGLLLSSSLTAMLTGITEPLEFSFLFVAPVLFVVHSVFTGLAYMVAHLLNITIGLTFSGGFIDFFLFGILQGNSKTGWLMLIPVGLIYTVIYYFVFSFLIRKLDLKTPGREEGSGETKLYTRDDYNAKKSAEKKEGTDNGSDEVSEIITKGLGGKKNISDVDCCATRLRITVNDKERVSESLLKSTGAAGVVIKGNGVQVIYGPKVNIIKSDLEEYLAKAPDEYSDNNASGSSSPNDTILDNKLNQDDMEKKKDGKTLLNDKDKVVKCTVIYSPISGTAAPIETAPDEAFAGKMMGDGAVVTPKDGKIVAPSDGTVSFVFPSKHAIGFTTEDGLEMLIHIGIDTVKLNGKGFKTFVKDGDEVKKGDILLEADLDYIGDNAPSLASPVIFTELEDNQKVCLIASGDVKAGDELMVIETCE
ncbi:MAG: glucose PTS transporter subunit IIA [Lachnospiraceae bacterium]|nr:glucose PTS transporter subunit IIA [Lachnospiraceae bacterium]